MHARREQRLRARLLRYGGTNGRRQELPNSETSDTDVY